MPSPTDPASYLATTAGTPYHAVTAHGPWGAAPGAVLVVAMVIARGAGEEAGGGGARGRGNGTSRFTLLATTSPQVTSPFHSNQHDGSIDCLAHSRLVDDVINRSRRSVALCVLCA